MHYKAASNGHYCLMPCQRITIPINRLWMQNAQSLNDGCMNRPFQSEMPTSESHTNGQSNDDMKK